VLDFLGVGHLEIVPTLPMPNYTLEDGNEPQPALLRPAGRQHPSKNANSQWTNYEWGDTTRERQDAADATAMRA